MPRKRFGIGFTRRGGGAAAPVAPVTDPPLAGMDIWTPAHPDNAAVSVGPVVKCGVNDPINFMRNMVTGTWSPVATNAWTLKQDAGGKYYFHYNVQGSYTFTDTFNGVAGDQMHLGWAARFNGNPTTAANLLGMTDGNFGMALGNGAAPFTNTFPVAGAGGTFVSARFINYNESTVPTLGQDYAWRMTQMKNSTFSPDTAFIDSKVPTSYTPSAAIYNGTTRTQTSPYAAATFRIGSTGATGMDVRVYGFYLVFGDLTAPNLTTLDAAFVSLLP